MAQLAISIQSVERRLRGGTQALLVRDSSGVPYVAKFVGNPQGTRTLINEWIVNRLLKHLRVSTPEIHPLRLQRKIPGGELLYFHIGNRTLPIQEGIHLGSRCPVDPSKKAIFDFLPRTLLNKIANLPDLLFALVFDKWVNQTDTRQAIFIRERSAADTPTPTLRTYLIDQGLCFGGSRWEFEELPLAGLFHDRSIYSSIDLEAVCHANVEKIQQLSDECLFSTIQDLPEEWLQAEDRDELNRLLETLAKRRLTLHDTVDRTLRQLQEAGIVTPTYATSRNLLALAVILACIPSALAARAIVNVERTDVSNRAHQGLKNMPATGGEANFQLIARTQSGELLCQRSFRVQAQKKATDIKTAGGTRRFTRCDYLLKISDSEQTTRIRQRALSFIERT